MATCGGPEKRSQFAILDLQSRIASTARLRLVQNKNLVEDYLQLIPNKIETRMFSTALRCALSEHRLSVALLKSWC